MPYVVTIINILRGRNYENAYLVLLVSGIVALVSAWRFPSQGAHPDNWKALLALALFGGVALGFGSRFGTYWLGYPYSSPEGPGRVVGIPFMVAYFDAEGRDYLFDFMWISLVANGIFWFLVPPSLLRLYGARWRKNHVNA